MRNNKKDTKNPPKQLHRQNDQEEKQNVSKRQQKKMKNSHEETLNDHKKVQIDHKDAWNDNKGHPQPPQRDTKTTTKLHTCTPSTDTRKRRMHRMTQLRTDSTQTQNSDGVKSENQNRPQGHTHKTTKRLQTNCKTKQTQNLKRVKKMNTNRRGNIWFVSPEVLALMSEGFKCVCRSIVRSSTHQLTQRSLINTLFYTLCL